MTSKKSVERWGRHVFIPLLVAAVAGPFVWWGWAGWRQLRYIDTLRQQGAYVDARWWEIWRFGDHAVILPTPYPEVDLLFEGCRADLHTASKLRRVEALTFREGATIPDTELEALGALCRLQWLTVWETQVNPRVLSYLCPLAPLHRVSVKNVPLDEASLAHLAVYPHLWHVNLVGGNVGDKELQLLSRLPNLHTLYLGGGRPTTEGLRCLAAFPELESLRLEECGLDDNAVRLVALPRLRRLSLTGNPIGDAACEYLVAAGMKDLQELDVSYTAITDGGVEILAALGDLDVLDLSGTQVTDEGLKALERMRLHHVWLRDTQVTEAGIGRLKDRLPCLQIN